MDEIYQTKRRAIIKTPKTLVFFRFNNIHYHTIVCFYLSLYSHIDDSHLRIHLLEYYRLKLYQSNFVMYSKIIINKIIPLLQTPNIVANHIPINFESYTLVLDMDETLIYYDGEKVY